MNLSSDRCSRNILILTLCSDKQSLEIKHIFNSNFSEGKFSSKKNFLTGTGIQASVIIKESSKFEAKVIMRRKFRLTGSRFLSEENVHRV